jgi:hypothetical protein
VSESDIDPEDERLIEGSREPVEDEWNGPDDAEPIKTDPATAERVRVHEKFEESMAEKGLLADDHSVRLDPEAVVHEEPPGTEQSAG